MMDKLYELYLDAFPAHAVKRPLFESKLFADGVTLLTEYRDGALAGFVLTDKEAITLLAVVPRWQKKGVGSALLAAAEEHIAAKGFNRVRLGQGRHYLMQGVPEGSADFFEKRGYAFSWVSEDMTLSLENCDKALSFVACPDGIRFSFAASHDREALHYAVNEVNPNWVRYFTEDRRVLLAKEGEKTVGFAIPEEGFYSLDTSVGSFGCLGVIPEARRRGIGRAIVAYALKTLREMGYSVCELRYVSSTAFYAPLGFTVARRFLMGDKSL